MTTAKFFRFYPEDEQNLNLIILHTYEQEGYFLNETAAIRKALRTTAEKIQQQKAANGQATTQPAEPALAG